MSISLSLRYREADRSGVDATERPLITHSSQEEGAQPPHPMPCRTMRGSSRVSGGGQRSQGKG